MAERYFARANQYRRVETWYDKTADNFLRFVWVASLALTLAGVPAARAFNQHALVDRVDY